MTTNALFIASVILVGCGSVATPVEPTCDEYCATIQDSCSAFPQYPSEAGCVVYCEQFGQIPIGTTDDVSGNTVGCRQYHATVASAGEPDLHCPHAGPTGGNVCGSWCENYCYLAIQNCFGAGIELYSTESICLNACAMFPVDGAPGDVAGDTVQCRIRYAGLAASEPPLSRSTNCPLAGPSSNACI